MALSSDLANAFFYDSLLLSDTLIIDSDTIYIEQDQVSVIEDSVLSPRSSPKSIRRQLWCASIGAGVNVTSASIQSNSNGFRLLNDVVDLSMQPQANFRVGGEFGARFLSLKGNRGNIELTASVAFSLNKIKIQYASVKTPSQLLQDSIVQFSSESNELILSYFLLTEPPDRGEVDTLSVALSRPLLAYSTKDLLATLRATFSRGFKYPRFYVETGVAKRFVKFAEGGDPFYLLSEDGRWTTIQSENLKGRNLLVPHFAIGFEKNISGEFSSNNRFVTLGASFSASVPSATFSNNESIAIELSNTSVLVFARSFF